MFPRLLSCSLVVLWSASLLPAQTESGLPRPTIGQPPVDTTDANDRELIASRLRFLQEMYGLDAEKAAQLRTTLNEQLPAHRSYQDQLNLTFRRLRVALSLLEQDATLSPDQREKRMAKFEGQYHHRLADAPLSMANIIRQGEALLSKGQVTEGRTRIRAKLADRLGPESDGFDLDRINAVLAGPVFPIELPDLSKSYPVPEPDPSAARDQQQRRAPAPTASAAPPRPRAPLTTDSRQPRPDPDPRETLSPRPPAVKTQRPLSRTARQAPAPPKPLEPAPPEAEWANYVDQASADYGFSKAQEQAARAVFSSCRSRAQAHRSGRQAEYQEVENTADQAERVEALRQLNLRLDQLYAELTERVDAVASLEQKRKADKGSAPDQTTPTPAPAKAGPQKESPKAEVPRNQSPKPDAPKKESPEKDAAR